MATAQSQYNILIGKMIRESSSERGMGNRNGFKLKKLVGKKESRRRATFEEQAHPHEWIGAKRTAQLDDDKCDHGLASSDSRSCQDFAEAFVMGFVRTYKNESTLQDAFNAAVDATHDDYADVWQDSVRIEKIISYFLARGVRNILRGNINDAGIDATYACYFEEEVVTRLNNSSAHQLSSSSHSHHSQQSYYSRSDSGGTTNSSSGSHHSHRIAGLRHADEHILINFFRRRIPCSCLDERYRQIRSKVKRSAMLYCTHCYEPYYCSHECCLSFDIHGKTEDSAVSSKGSAVIRRRRATL
jgi:hypothetical protein